MVNNGTRSARATSNRTVKNRIQRSALANNKKSGATVVSRYGDDHGARYCR